nr:beta-lactamase family protein [Ktedonobacterales bacterium]
MAAPLALLLYALVLLAGCAGGSAGGSAATPAPVVSAAAAGIDAYLERQALARRFSGAALVAARGGRVLLSKGYGLADAAAGIPNTARTRFRIGSLTKQFTAMAILLLRERGRLRVSDAVCRYLARCPAAWRPITIEELLTHTSGIPDLAERAITDYTKPLSPEALLALIESEPLAFAPGTSFRYSSAGYNVLGVVIERVSGQAYGTFLQQAIFGPLGMTATAYDVNRPIPPEHARGYTTWGTPAPYLDMSLPFAAGALASTVGDLARWERALEMGTTLPRPAVAEMLTPHVTICASGAQPCAGRFTRLGYGYGWYVGRDKLGLVEY